MDDTKRTDAVKNIYIPKPAYISHLKVNKGENVFVFE